MATCKDCLHFEVCQELRYGDISNCNSDYCGGIFKPKADVVEVIRAEWVVETNMGGYLTPGGNPLWKCSHCGEIYGSSMFRPKQNHCGNCGAKMEVKPNEKV